MHQRQELNPSLVLKSLSTTGELSTHDTSTGTGMPGGRKKDAKHGSLVLLDDNDNECIGFSSLSDQVHRKAIKRGFDFTLMVVGESGLGKSTLISSMFFKSDLYGDRVIVGSEERLTKTVEFETRHLEIEERGVKLRLTIVDTPGFNDALNASQCWKPIENYINQQYDEYLADESGLNRHNLKDNRIHCCLYFLSPSAHGLRPVDIEFMRRLHNKVNIVPVIAKADMLTPSELKRMKTTILGEIQEHAIHLYELPECDSDEDQDVVAKNKELKNAIPFSVIGSNTVVEVNGKRVKGRIYPWGLVEAENPLYSDLALLRQFLTSTHLHDLKDVTRDVHYENFRVTCLQNQPSTNSQPINQLRQLNQDSSPTVQQSRETDKLLQQKDDELQRMRRMLRQMQLQMSSSGPPVE